jgi:hypothetical protein
MKNTFRFAIIFFAIFTIQACSENSSSPNDAGDAFYFNSFEADKDTLGWTGLSKSMFANDPCPATGHRSIHIGGGCIQPAASIELPALMRGKYKLNFWGKMGQKSQAAQIVLKISGENSESNKIAVGVSGTDWKEYFSSEILSVPSGKKLKLEILVGGIIFADVFVDNLKIIKVN